LRLSAEAVSTPFLVNEKEDEDDAKMENLRAVAHFSSEWNFMRKSTCWQL
jgi:hypothetical protein